MSKERNENESKDDRTQHRIFGYSLSDKRAEKNCIYIQGKRYTFEAALGSNGIIAYKIKEDAISSDDFYDFITQDLNPKAF
ncbi:12604_t:CDS:2 [Funneliformis caledonium]|uniref:12604_t:CDS:1 n=1 Tax=Funneliformis caledonium TaxID=1117310 RepID=A0A9N9AD24_9GLOM|nr:12604_t:CDS:2 [Funneliformis caledonium]